MGMVPLHTYYYYRDIRWDTVRDGRTVTWLDHNTDRYDTVHRNCYIPDTGTRCNAIRYPSRDIRSNE